MTRSPSALLAHCGSAKNRSRTCVSTTSVAATVRIALRARWSLLGGLASGRRLAEGTAVDPWPGEAGFVKVMRRSVTPRTCGGLSIGSRAGRVIPAGAKPLPATIQWHVSLP
ncbi:unannotated protein [freshwater metagenome]|uniref:Unannotated protein n=1 Tax=freshwater metagenome TaxID=449393 RepID=A0A6J7KLN9_9ZZZZ